MKLVIVVESARFPVSHHAQCSLRAEVANVLDELLKGEDHVGTRLNRKYDSYVADIDGKMVAR